MNHEKVQVSTRKLYLLAVITRFAMPWPTIPQPNPTEPYKTPWIQNKPTNKLKTENVLDPSFLFLFFEEEKNVTLTAEDTGSGTV